MCYQWGIQDPEAWLDSVSDEQLATWEGYFAVEQFGADWERHGAVMSMLDGIFAVLLNQHIPETEKGKRHTPRPAREFMPGGFFPPEAKPTIREQLEAFGRAMKGQR